MVIPSLNVADDSHTVTQTHLPNTEGVESGEKQSELCLLLLSWSCREIDVGPLTNKCFQLWPKCHVTLPSTHEIAGSEVG